MAILLPYGRLFLLILLSTLLGFLVLRTPGLKVVPFPDGKGSITVPRSLEGWRFKQGEGETLLTGTTWFGLHELEVVRTGATHPGDLYDYIARRQHQRFLATEGYQPRLKGEVRRFGLVPAPVARGVYMGTYPLLPVKTQIVEHDLFWAYDGEYLRITVRFPLSFQPYVGMDHYIIAADLARMNGGE